MPDCLNLLHACFLSQVALEDELRALCDDTDHLQQLSQLLWLGHPDLRQLVGTAVEPKHAVDGAGYQCVDVRRGHDVVLNLDVLVARIDDLRRQW